MRLLILLLGFQGYLFAQKPAAGAHWKFDSGREAYAVVNARGAVCTDFVFQEPQPFRQGMAAARKGSAFYLVRSDGTLLPDSFELVLPATDGFYFTWSKKQSTQWFDSRGQIAEQDPFYMLATPEPKPLFKQQGKYALVDSSGIVVTPFVYDQIGQVLDRDIYIVKAGDKYGLLDQHGKVIAPLEHSYLAGWGPDLIVFARNKKYGAYNGDGKLTAPAVYDTVEQFFFYNSGAMPVRVRKDGRYGALDLSGKEIIPPVYSHLRAIHAPLSFIFGEGDKYGIRDSTGKMVVPARYQDVRAFNSGEFAVQENGLWGVVDGSGKEVLPARYTFVQPYRPHYYVVEENDARRWIDKQGETVFALNDPDIKMVSGNSGMQQFIIRQGTGLGLIDRNGRELLPPEYETIRWVNDTLLIVEKDGKSALMNDRLELLTPYSYDELFLAGLDLIGARHNGLIGLMDLSGKERAKAQYLNIRPFGKKLLLGTKRSVVRRKGQDISGFDKTERVTEVPDYNDGSSLTFVFIDSSGQELPGKKFNKVGDLFRGISEVELKGKKGFVDEDANIVLPTEFIECRGLTWYVRVRKYGSGLWGVWHNGQEVIPCLYEKIGAFRDAYIWVQKGDDRFYLDKQNQSLILSSEEAKQQLPLRADILAQYDAFGLPGEENDWIRVRKAGKWGWIDRQGKEMIPCRFEAVTPFQRGRARVLVQPYYGELWLNSKGEVILGPQIR